MALLSFNIPAFLKSDKKTVPLQNNYGENELNPDQQPGISDPAYDRNYHVLGPASDIWRLALATRRTHERNHVHLNALQSRISSTPPPLPFRCYGLTPVPEYIKPPGRGILDAYIKMP